MTTTEPDKWHFTVTCKGCGKLFGFAEAPDPSQTKERVQLASESIPLVCGACGERHEYRDQEILIRRQGRTN